MLLFLSILGFFLSLILLYFNVRKNLSTIYLGFFFLLISLYGFYQYALLYSKSVFLIEILLIGFPIVFPPLYLIGPMLYWYIRSVLTDNSRLKKNDIWHLLPTIIYFLVALPYVFLPLSHKLEAAREVVKNVGFMQTYHATILDQIFSVSAIYLSRPILILGYTLWSIGLLLRYSTKRNLSKVFVRQYFMTKWLCLLLALLLVLEVTHIFLISKAFKMHFSELFFTLNVLRILSAAGLTGLLISPFFYPAILYGLPRLPKLDTSPTLVTDNTELLTEKTNKIQYNLEEVYLLTIHEKTEEFMKETKPYLQPGFNLLQLSVDIQVPAHHISYFFREIKKQTFNDYRNEWRINHAKNLIEKGKASEMTLEGIGMLSGFSSRNAFVTDFKKLAGESPGSYAARFN